MTQPDRPRPGATPELPFELPRAIDRAPVIVLPADSFPDRVFDVGRLDPVTDPFGSLSYLADFGPIDGKEFKIRFLREIGEMNTLAGLEIRARHKERGSVWIFLALPTNELGAAEVEDPRGVQLFSEESRDTGHFDGHPLFDIQDAQTAAAFLSLDQSLRFERVDRFDLVLTALFVRDQLPAHMVEQSPSSTQLTAE